MKITTVLLAGALLATLSCTRSVVTPTASTTKDMLIGKWKLYKAASDLNNNGSIDPSELVNSSDTVAIKYTFNSDGTGKYVDGPRGSGVSDFTWNLQSNNDIHLTLSCFPGPCIDTVRIYEISSTDLTLGIMVRNSPVYWLVMKK